MDFLSPSVPDQIFMNGMWFEVEIKVGLGLEAIVCDLLWNQLDVLSSEDLESEWPVEGVTSPSTVGTTLGRALESGKNEC